LYGEGESVWRRADFLVRRVDGPFWGEALFASLGEGIVSVVKDYMEEVCRNGRRTSFWHLRRRFSVDVDVEGLGGGMFEGYMLSACVL
jgi:hypothetical protein